MTQTQMLSPTSTTTSTTAGPLQPTSPQAAPTAHTTTATTTATTTTTTTARPGAVPSMPVETGQPNPYARAAYSGYRQNTSAMEPPFQQQQEPAGDTLLGRLGRWVDAVNSRLVKTRIAGDAKGKGVAKG